MTGKLQILIVEDDVGTRKFIEKKLRTSDLATKSVHSGAEAIALCRKNQNYFLILDYQLQDMTGQKVIETLAAEEIVPPFVIMTGQGDEKVAVEMMKLGALDYIVKDVNFIDLLPSLIQRALDRLQVDEKLRQTEEEFRALFEQMLTGVVYFKVLTDGRDQPHDLVYIRVNRTFERMLDLKRKDILGKKLTEVFPDIHELEIDWINILGQVAVTGEDYTFEQFFEPLAKWFSGTAYRTEKDHCAVIFNDITNLKLSEKSLMDARNELKRKNEELEAFVYTAAHDLKTPLTSAQGFFELVQRRIESKLEDKEKELIAEVPKNLHRLDSLLRDLLRFSTINENPDIIYKVPIKPVIERIVEEERQLFNHTKASITVANDLPQVLLHETRCYQLFKNLISNSLKYAREKVPLKITIKLAQNCSTEAPSNYQVFAVTDNGIGIPKDFVDRVFDIYVRKENNKIGSGVGLAIAKRIVDQAKGDIWAESEAGKGTVFYISLPVEEEKS